MTILSKTTLGKWSAILAAVFVLVFVLNSILFEVVFPVSSGEPVPIYINLALGLGTAIALASFVIGLVGIVKSRERSVLVFLGMAVTFWFGIIAAVGIWLI